MRTVRGNQWMFRTGHPQDLPLRIRKELLTPTADGGYPILAERTSVRMTFRIAAGAIFSFWAWTS